uniref:DUF4220 domain-containing protein n=1 Tax=Oryza rufipogon TaxID=4529 RepID=A0A0E0P546_ORYRU
MSADSVAMYTLGHMSLNSGLPEQQLVAFWAPFLPLHLGGQDTITAYAVEDNRLWMHDLQSFAVQVAAAGGMDVIPGQRKSRRARGQSSDGDAEGLLLEAHLLFDICKRLIKGPGVAHFEKTSGTAWIGGDVQVDRDAALADLMHEVLYAKAEVIRTCRLLAVSLSSTAGQCHREQQQSQRFHHLHPVTRGQHPGDHFGAEGSLIRLDVGALVSTGMYRHSWFISIPAAVMRTEATNLDDEVGRHRGRVTLRRWGLFEELGWSVGNEDDGDQASSFASSILLWHIATDVYLKLYRKEIDQDEGQRALVEAIKTLANYMFFLLVVRPQMLPAGSVEQQQQYATKLRAVELGKSDLLAGTFCASFWLSVSRIVRGMIGRKLSTFEHAPNDRCTLGGVPVLCGLRKPNA